MKTFLLAFLIFLVIPVAMATHVVLATTFGVFEQWPVGPLILIAASIAGLAWLLLRKRPFNKAVLGVNVIAWVGAGLFLWWTQVSSEYDVRDRLSSVGNLAVSGLVDQTGTAVDLVELAKQKRAMLLVFYRGSW